MTGWSNEPKPHAYSGGYPGVADPPLDAETPEACCVCQQPEAAHTDPVPGEVELAQAEAQGQVARLEGF